ncbi:hypothetical protein ATE48_16295 [Candidatus Viadribacter manganicus]|uniref:Uncharacterized protein n=2 Tax=Candidatus Viadribacter manganicus TaxID=1759059 RepID=A0A1B1ALG9_9PROT|nr:hypothetical protein ATE48_16295 [Candidatus Viadribacter manganicus]
MDQAPLMATKKKIAPKTAIAKAALDVKAIVAELKRAGPAAYKADMAKRIGHDHALAEQL